MNWHGCMAGFDSEQASITVHNGVSNNQCQSRAEMLTKVRLGIDRKDIISIGSHMFDRIWKGSSTFNKRRWFRFKFGARLVSILMMVIFVVRRLLHFALDGADQFCLWSGFSFDNDLLKAQWWRTSVGADSEKPADEVSLYCGLIIYCAASKTFLQDCVLMKMTWHWTALCSSSASLLHWRCLRWLNSYPIGEGWCCSRNKGHFLTIFVTTCRDAFEY